MSDDTLTDDAETDKQSENADLRRLRAKAKEADQLKEELAEAQAKIAKTEREAAFAKAGINPDDPKQSYFVKGYDGDITPEAIKEAATAAGFLTDQPKADETPPAEIRQWAQTANLPAGGAPGLDTSQAMQAEIAAIPYGEPRQMANALADILERHGGTVSRNGIWKDAAVS